METLAVEIVSTPISRTFDGYVLVVGPVLKIKTGFRGFETEQNPGFQKFTEL